MLPKWKATTSHIFIFFGWSNHRHHTLSTSMSTRPDSPASVITRTTSDVNFEQAQHIYAIATRITHAVGILEELCSVIVDHTSSRNKLLKKASFVKKFVIPLFSETIITMTATAKYLSPIPGSKYVHQHDETKRKREIESSNNTSLTPGEEMIVPHVKAIKHINKMVDVTPAAKRHRCSTACVSPTDNSNVQLPAPKSGSGYSTMEVVNIMLELPVKDGRLRAATVKAIAEHQKKHNVLCCAKTINRLLKRHANGNAISGQFTGKGRPPTISDANMKWIAQSLEVEVGKTYTGSDVEWMIKNTQAENVESAGFKPIIEKSISRWTVKNYTAMLAIESNIAISQSYISKSNTRYAAENSIHGLVATLGVIATTYFIPIDKENYDIRQGYSSSSKHCCLNTW
jgi:hypothetical protein